MATDPVFEFVVDAISNNDVCNLDGSSLPKGIALSAASWFVPRSGAVSYCQILRTVVGSMERLHPVGQLFLLVGDEGWQPDSRLVRHGGFWGRISRRGTELDSLADLNEAVTERDGKLKAFGAARISQASVKSAASIVRTMSNTYLVTSPSIDRLDDLLQQGWSGGAWFDYKLLEKIIAIDQVLCKPVGSFDDPEVGFICLGSPDKMRKIAG